jgi:transposase
VIDKGIASPELLSHVLVSKYADHLPLYRQRLIYQRAALICPDPRYLTGLVAAVWNWNLWPMP